MLLSHCCHFVSKVSYLFLRRLPYGTPVSCRWGGTVLAAQSCSKFDVHLLLPNMISNEGFCLHFMFRVLFADD